MKKPKYVVTCSCGFRLGIQGNHLEELAGGVWGPIRCGECNKQMNELITALYEKESRNAK